LTNEYINTTDVEVAAASWFKPGTIDSLMPRPQSQQHALTWQHTRPELLDMARHWAQRL